MEKREDNVAKQRKMWKLGSCLQGAYAILDDREMQGEIVQPKYSRN